MKLNKQLPDSYMNQILKKVDKVEDDVNGLNSNVYNITSNLDLNFNNFNSIMTDLDSRLAFIEKYVGDDPSTLTKEEYQYMGTVTISGGNYSTHSVQVTFNKVFVEPPTVTVAITSNEDYKWSAPAASSITKTSCFISAYVNGGGARTCTIQYTVKGYIAKTPS